MKYIARCKCIESMCVFSRHFWVPTMCLTQGTLSFPSLGTHIRISCFQFNGGTEFLSYSEIILDDVCIKVLQRNRNNRRLYRHGYIDIDMRFSIRNWLVRLWRLSGPKIWSWQAGELGKLMISRSSSKAWKPGELVVSVSSSPNWSPKAGEDPCSSSKMLRQWERILPCSASYSI